MMEFAVGDAARNLNIFFKFTTHGRGKIWLFCKIGHGTPCRLMVDMA